MPNRELNAAAFQETSLEIETIKNWNNELPKADIYTKESIPPQERMPLIFHFSLNAYR